MAKEPVILFVEDNKFVLDGFAPVLTEEGYSVLKTHEPDEALRMMEENDKIDLLLVDVQMSIQDSTRLSAWATDGGQLAGLEIARLFRKSHSGTPVIFWTSQYNKNVVQASRKLGDAYVAPKNLELPYLLDLLSDALEGTIATRRPRPFIVHGHDEESLAELVGFVRDDLAFPDPVVLRDKGSATSTLIEKVEAESAKTDVVFVLLTPDDQVIEGGKIVFHARQNVLFEFGYFLGLLGRGTGRIILLKKGGVALPSDLGGLVPIDVSDGIRSQSEQIRRELEDYLNLD